MSNCNILLEITGFEPKNIDSIPYKDLICIFKLDNYEGRINIGEYNNQKINNVVKNVKKDLKFMIKIVNIKSNSLIGISDIILPFSLIKSTNILSKNEINKQCLLTMIESTKHSLFGSFSKERDIKISICIKFEVLSRNNISFIKRNYNKSQGLLNKTLKIENQKSPKIINKNKDKIKEFDSIKTPPNNKTKQIVDYKNDKFYTMPNNPINPLKKCQNKNKGINKIKKEFYSNRNEKGKVFKCNMKNKSIISDNEIYLKTSPNFNNNNIKKYNRKYNNSMTEIRSSIDHSKNISMIEPNIFDNYIETEDNSDKIDNEIYFSLNYLKSNFNIFMNDNNKESINQKVIEDNIESFNNFHSLLILKLELLLQKRKDLIDFYKSNIENVNYIIKKRNKLTQLNLKSNHEKIKVNLNSKCNTNIYRNQCQIHKKELKIFQNIFNSHYFEYDILKYKESLLMKNMDKDDKLNLLISCVRASVFSYGNISQIYEDDEDSKIKLKALLFRYKIKESEEENLLDLKNNSIKKNYDVDKIKIIKEVDEEKEDDSEDEFEEQINKKIKEIENKKLSSIKFVKISKNEFQYGKHKIKITLDNSDIKVDLGNNNLLKLEDFILKNKKKEDQTQKRIPKSFFKKI